MRLDIYLKIKEHNNFVEKELAMSDKGCFVNLTDLLIKKEQIIKDIYKNY